MDYSRSSIISHRSAVRRAFTLVECLIGLAISAILLTAVAVAFNASVINYSENEDMFRTVNNARQALARMTTQIRMAGYQHPTLGLLSVPYVAVPTSDCSLWIQNPDGTGEQITFEFRNADRTLYLVKNATGAEYVLCNDVVDAEFRRTPAVDPSDSKSVQISLTVEISGTRRTLSAAAVIRRNLAS